MSAKSRLTSGFLVEWLLTVRDMRVVGVGVIGHALLSRCRRGSYELTMKKERVLELLFPLLLQLVLLVLGHCLVVDATRTRALVVHESCLAIRAGCN